MRKLRLDLDEVKIESFEIEEVPLGRGTVRGQQECEEGGGIDPGGGENCSCCYSCWCCACSCPCCCRCRCCGVETNAI